MSLSEALGSLPVVRHFYPIDPVTSTQQSAFVYNPPSAPLVAPIQPYVFPQPRDPKTKTVKRKLEQDEFEEEGLVLDSASRRPKRPKMADKPSQDPEVDVVPIRLLPRAQRKIPYIDIHRTGSLDRSLYKPILLSSYGSKNLDFGRGKRPSSRLGSYDPDSDSPVGPSKAKAKTQGTGNGKQKGREEQPDTIHIVVEDDETSCHQCRRKSMALKMRCRNVLPLGIVCGMMFCKTCIHSRYGEDFKPEHLSWICPRCHGMCNCSICLRKAGLGYILDLAGVETRGSLSTAMKKGTNKKRKYISVRKWLAQQGLALGVDEWTEEQRRQGVRYFVGMKPPPLDGSSPYKDARFNDTLNPREDEQDMKDTGSALDPFLMSDGSSAPRVEVPTQLRDNDIAGPSLETGSEKGPSPGVSILSLPSTPIARDPSIVPSEGRVSQEMPEASPYADTEDLPGLTPAQTRRVRLIVGSRLPLSERRKRVSSSGGISKSKYAKPGKLKKKEKKKKTKKSDDHPDYIVRSSLPSVTRKTRGSVAGGIPNVKSIEAGIPKKKESDYDSDYDPDDDLDYIPSGTTSLKIRLPAIHVHKQPVIPFLEENAMIEYSDEQPEVGSPSGDSEHARMFSEDEDEPEISPPQEPVFVPTEHYPVSKLDLTYVKDPTVHLSQSFWDTLGAFDTQTDVNPQAQLLLSYDGTSPYDLSPSNTGSTNVSTHQSSTPTDFLGTQHDSGYAVSGLPSFTALDETWIAGSGSGMPGMDMSPLHMEHLLHSSE